MGNAANTVRLVLLTMTLAELAVVIARLRHRPARREAAWLALLLASFAARLAAPRGGVGDSIVPVAVLLSSGNLLLAIHDRSGTPVWSGVSAGFLALLLAARALGLEQTAIFTALRALGYGLLGLVPLGLTAQLRGKTGEAADLLLLVSAVAWAAAGATELALGGRWGGRLADSLLAPILACVGFMLVEQGYLSPLTSPGYADRLAVHRRLMREAHGRLMDTENALAAQDRLIAAGLIALGASHEFKNVLASLRAAAGHGLARSDPLEKDRSLRLMLEHAAAGEESATALLERLGREGREETSRFELRDLLERLARTLRPVIRHAGARLAVECGGVLTVDARPGEVQQVLLNLARNAVESFGRGPGCSDPLVRICASQEGARALIEVLDNAGGVPGPEVPLLFKLGRSSRGSTGIGLYLARSLAERNGGSLAYRAIEGGSRFALELPLAGPADPLGAAVPGASKGPGGVRSTGA